jgi:large subunit ribosomal protein L23
MRIQEIVRNPLITEKSTIMREETGVVVFEVDRRANKIEIKNAVEKQFNVKVAEVRVARVHGKERRQGRYSGRRPDWKKAYVRLTDDSQKIAFFEGM